MTTASSQTLVAIARAIFQDWFVDFGPVRAKMEGRDPHLPKAMWKLFPEDLENQELGDMPKGWGTAPLRETADSVRRLLTPGRLPDKTFRHFSIPAYDRGATPRTELGRDIRSGKLQVPPDTVLVSRLNPEIRTGLAGGRPAGRTGHLLHRVPGAGPQAAPGNRLPLLPGTVREIPATAPGPGDRDLTQPPAGTGERGHGDAGADPAG